MTADYRFSLQRKTQRFSSLGTGTAAPLLQPNARNALLAPSVRDSLISAEIRFNLPRLLRANDVWARDAAYASSAALVDYRQENCCGQPFGGLRCRTPFMTFQMWNIGIECNSESMAKYLFPVDRFVWAQEELRRLLAVLPGTGQPGRAPISLENLPMGAGTDAARKLRVRSGNMRVGSDPEAWAKWCTDVLRCVALLRWSTNLRWSLVKSELGLSPNEDAYAFHARNDIGGIWTTNPVDLADLRRMIGPSEPPDVKRYYDLEYKRYLNSSFGLVALSRLTSDYDQLGGDPTVFNASGEGPLSAFPLRPVRIPVSKSDFDPVIAISENSLWSPPLPPDLRGAGSAEELLARHFSFVSLLPPAFLEKFHWTFDFVAPQFEYGGEVRNRPVSSIVPSPFAQVLQCAALAQDAIGFDYLVYINRTLEEWIRFYEALPEQFRVLDIASMRSAMAAMIRAQTDAASNMIAGAGGTIAAIATAINPIAGVVVTLLVAIAVLVARFAADLCIVMAENPPWVASPFIRFIDTTPDGQGACDFEVTDAGGAAAFADSKARMISALAARGITPSDWFGMLDTLEASADRNGDGTRESDRGISPVAVAAALVAGLLLLSAAKKSKKKERTL